MMLKMMCCACHAMLRISSMDLLRGKLIPSVVSHGYGKMSYFVSFSSFSELGNVMEWPKRYLLPTFFQEGTVREVHRSR